MRDTHSLDRCEAHIGVASAYVMVDGAYLFAIGGKHGGDTLAVFWLGGHRDAGETADVEPAPDLRQQRRYARIFTSFMCYLMQKGSYT